MSNIWKAKGATSLLGLAFEGIINVFFKLKKAGYLFENKEIQTRNFPGTGMQKLYSLVHTCNANANPAQRTFTRRTQI